MAEIVDALGMYPSKKCLPDVAEIYKIPQVIYGDQLTVTHIQGAVKLQSSNIIEEKKLNDFTEAISNWHSRLFSYGK